jgi:hypothetical protein
VEFIYFGISYDNPCSPLSFSLLPAPGSRASLIPFTMGSDRGMGIVDDVVYQVGDMLEKRSDGLLVL